MKFPFRTSATRISSFPPHLLKIFSLTALLPSVLYLDLSQILNLSETPLCMPPKLSPHLSMILHCMKSEMSSPQPGTEPSTTLYKSTSVVLFLMLQNKCFIKRNQCVIFELQYLQTLNFNSSNIQYQFKCQFLYSL